MANASSGAAHLPRSKGFEFLSKNGSSNCNRQSINETCVPDVIQPPARRPPCIPQVCQCLVPYKLPIWIVIFVVFLQTIAFHLHHCAVNKLVNEVHTGNKIYTKLQSWRPVILALGCPFYGSLGDICGNAFSLELSMAFSSISYVLEIFACNQQYLTMVSALLLLVHTYLGSQMVIAEISCCGQRAKLFLYLAFFFKLGINVGSSIGKYLVDYFGSRQTILLAALISGVSVVLFHLYFLEFVGWEPERWNYRNLTKSLKIQRIVRVMMTNEVFVLTWARCLVGIPFCILYLYYPIRLVEYLSPAYSKVGAAFDYLRWSDLGLLLLFWLAISYYKDDIWLHRGALLLTLIAYYAIGFGSSFLTFSAAYALLSGCIAAVVLITRSIASKLVRQRDRGTALGILMMAELLLPQSPYLFRALGLVEQDVNMTGITQLGVVVCIVTLIMLFTIFKRRQ